MTPQQASPQIQYLPIEAIEANPFQYRDVIEDEDFHGMVVSVAKRGVLQPILVRPIESKSYKGIEYQLIAGERRWRAATAARLSKIPAIVKLLSDEEALELALIENAQRQDPPHFATARGIKRRMEMAAGKGEPMNRVDVAKLLGKSLGFIDNHLNLFGLDEPLQELVASRNDAMSSAFELQKIKGHREYRPLIEDAREGKKNFRAVKERVEWVLGQQRLQRESSRPPDKETRQAIAKRTQREMEAIREASSALKEAQRHLLNFEAWINDISADSLETEFAAEVARFNLKSEEVARRIVRGDLAR